MQATEIAIATPCGADWRTMKALDNKRFCDACKKHVHDLSSMTQDDARALLASPPVDGLCVRYLHDAHGDVIFRRDVMAPSRLVRARRLVAYAATAAIPFAMTACTAALNEPPPMPMMGAVACPMPPPDSPESDAGAAEPGVVMGEPGPMSPDLPRSPARPAAR